MQIIVFMFLFLLVEVPQSMMELAMAVLPMDMHRCVAMFIDPAELLTVLYSSINFAIFCLMSQQFRVTFSVGYRRGLRNIHGDLRTVFIERLSSSASVLATLLSRCRRRHCRRSRSYRNEYCPSSRPVNRQSTKRIFKRG
jgi:hypothetical protein